MSGQTASPGFSLATDSLTGLHYLGIVLAAVTGAIHLWLGVQFISSPLGISFLAAGIGFLAGIAAVVADVRRRLFYVLGIPFTLAQVVAWYVFNQPTLSSIGPVDGIDKIAQVGFVVVLVLLLRD
jgi:hypothetical protein